MLRFNIITYFSYVVIPKFQYILCYGSTRYKAKNAFCKGHFNTSYVTVQHDFAIKTLNHGKEFQYILCYGSTKCNTYCTFRCSIISIHPMLRFNPAVTSNVIKKMHFNTSYVTVQQLFFDYFGKMQMHFNTSYVTVQQRCFQLHQRIYPISIHPMLRFNCNY